MNCFTVNDNYWTFKGPWHIVVFLKWIMMALKYDTFFPGWLWRRLSLWSSIAELCGLGIEPWAAWLKVQWAGLPLWAPGYPWVINDFYMYLRRVIINERLWGLEKWILLETLHIRCTHTHTWTHTHTYTSSLIQHTQHARTHAHTQSPCLAWRRRI